MSFPTESRLGRTAAATGTRTHAATVTRYAQTRAGALPRAAFLARVAGRRTARALGAAGRWCTETFTAAGALLVAVVIGGVAAGLAFGWIEAWFAAATAAIVIVCCIPFLLGAHDYAVDLAIDRDRVVAGTDVEGRLDIANRGSRLSLPGVVDIPVGDGLVEVHVPLLRAGGRHSEVLAISARRRGVIDIGPMTIARGDPIGILRREMGWPEMRRVFVHPVTTVLPSTSAGLVRDLEGTPTTVLVDADLSFHAVREYVVGDSQRHVHWKSTAKTGRLMVRQYEESRHARIAVLLDLDAAEYASDDEFEMAVSAAASLGVQGVRDGRDVLVSMSGEIPELAIATVQSIRTVPTRTPKALLDGMAAVDRSESVMRLEAVATLTAQSFGDLSIAMLVTGSRVPLSRLRQATLALPADAAVLAVRCEPGAEPRLAAAGELTVLTIGALGDLAFMLARGAVR